MSLNSIITIAISRLTAGVSQAGFGVPLVLGPNATHDEHIRFYTDMDGVAEDFTSSQDEYKAASAIFSQDPAPPRIAIGKREANVAAVQTLTFSADLVASNSVAGTVNGTALSATVYATSHEATMNALAAKIQAIDGVATAVVSSTPFRVITVTSDAGRTLSLSGFAVTLGASQAAVAVAETTPSVTVADALDDILDTENGNDWYMLILTSRADADIMTAAAWVESRSKMFMACSDAAGIIASTTTDVAALLNAAGYNRTALLYHDAPGTFPEAAWAGACLPLDPGSETWKFKTLAGITNTVLTNTQYTNADGKNANAYQSIGGVSITREGTVASGEYIDVMRFVDWLEARIQEGIYSLLVNTKKVPMTDAGAAQVEAAIRTALMAGVRVGGLVDGSLSVSVPLIADVSTADKALRKLPDVTFGGTLAGAVHSAELAGSVTL